LPRSIDYTVAYSAAGGTVDLCKIIMGGDGSYYLTAPFHPHDKALAAIMTVNYAEPQEILRFEEALEVAVLEDDDKRLKLSHHPDGFIQFSGEGVLSGRNQDGSPKGLGTYSWPLRRPTLGPSFGMAFGDPHGSGRPTMGRPRTVIFEEEDIAHMRKGELAGLRIAGYYLPVPWREYVQRIGPDRYEIGIVNPGAQAVLRLRVLLAPVDSDLPGLIGLQAVPHGLLMPSGGAGYMVTSSTGNLRRNEDGDLLGDQLVCVYPRPNLSDPANYMSLNYPLPAPPYRAPPSTQEVELRLPTEEP
jgi:hypothetical protein